MKKIVSGFTFILLILLVIGGCEKDKPTGLYDPDFVDNPAPVIDSLEPEQSALAGIVEITIQGENFAPEPDQNFVYFGKHKAEVLQASETQLIVRSPNVIQDSLELKIAVHGSEEFSNVVYYDLIEAIGMYSDYDEFDDPYVIACDNEENLYIVLGGKNVEKVAPDESRSLYGTTTFLLTTSIRYGPGGYLYLARKSKDIYRIPPGGGESEKWVRAPGRVEDLDFSPTGVIYAGGKGDNLYAIYSADSAANVADYPDTYIKSVRVYDGYVYVGGEDNEDHFYIWRNQIISDSELGQKEVVFDWDTNIDESSEILSMTFSEDGDLLVGTDAAESIVVIHPDGSYEPLYQGLLEPISYFLCWGTGNFLYVCKRNDDPTLQGILKVNMLKKGAPYYGRM